MRKIVTILAMAVAALTASAQERGFYGNKFTDNWYIGAEGSFSSKTTHQAVFQNINSGFGLKIGKYFSPIFGVGLEGNAFFSNKACGHNLSGDLSGINYYQIGLFASANLMNAIKGYYGEPRRFEIQPMVGFYWGHNNEEKNYQIGTRKNTLVNKLGVDFFYNLGKKKMFQIFVEPSINYVIAGVQEENIDAQGIGNEIVLYNINNSFLGLNIGLNYKFLTSNGSHNFMVVEACDQTEMDELNNAVNELKKKGQDDAEELAKALRENERLQKALKECEDKPAVVKDPEMPDLPAVFYQCDKSVITPAQTMNVSIAAEVLKKHPEYSVDIKGYASPEGPHGNNTSLGIRRADAVKDMLIKKYNISADRIKAEGCGETDKLFPIYELNRVATMKLTKEK